MVQSSCETLFQFADCPLLIISSHSGKTVRALTEVFFPSFWGWGWGCNGSSLLHVGSRVVTKRGYSAVAVCRLLFAVPSLVAEHGSAQEHERKSTSAIAVGACMGLVALRQCEIFPDQGFTLICVLICQYNLTTVICNIFDLKK